jgi:hypothetical protein
MTNSYPTPQPPSFTTFQLIAFIQGGAILFKHFVSLKKKKDMTLSKNAKNSKNDVEMCFGMHQSRIQTIQNPY